MRAEQHDLRAQRGIGAGDLGDHVVAVRVRHLVLGLHSHAELDRRAGVHRVDDHVVLLRLDDHRRHGIVTRGAVAEHEHRAVLALRRPQHHAGAHAAEQGAERASGHGRARIDERRCADRHRVVAHARLEPVLHDEGLLRFGSKDDRPAQSCGLRAHRVGVGEIADVHRRAHELALGRRRPALGIADERHVPRLHHLEDEPLEHPPASEGPTLLVHVLEPVAPELRRGPVRGLLERGRSGEARADDVREVVEGRAHLRTVEALVADAGEGRLVDRFLGGGCGGGRDGQEAGSAEKVHHGGVARGWWGTGTENGEKIRSRAIGRSARR